MMKRWSRNALLLSAITIVAMIALAGCTLPFFDEEPASAASDSDAPGVLLDDPQPAPDFSLTGHDGKPVSLADMDGKVIAIFFGYTRCPDICPMTLGYMAQATEALGDDADQVEYLLITVDPEQDDPERLAQYVSRVEAPITALAGARSDLEPVWDDYDITVERRDREDGGFLVDHSAQIWLVDQNSDLVMFMPMGSGGEDLTAGIRWLLDREG